MNTNQAFLLGWNPSQSLNQFSVAVVSTVSMGTGNKCSAAYFQRCSENVLYAHCDGQSCLEAATEEHSQKAGTLKSEIVEFPRVVDS